jgi:predicted Rdx family selenoprotein/SAM-dependent methyltransferase
LGQIYVNPQNQGPKEYLSIVDGKSSIPNLPVTSRPWIKGDTIVYTVALASIVARVTRDKLVRETIAPLYPQYGFEQHGGYPSKSHWHALHTFGPTPVHRRSCKQVRQRDTTTTTVAVTATSSLSSSSASLPSSKASLTTRTEFLAIAAAATTALPTWRPSTATAMYTDQKRGVQFPDVGEIAASVPTEWDTDELREISTDTARFRRLDGSSDAIFYADPRFVEHVDETAVQQIQDYLEAVIVRPSDVSKVLDLCSSWTSHLPAREAHGLQRLAGLGMNAKELEANPSLTEWIVLDLNEKPDDLPYEDQAFDAVVCQLSIDYLTRPVQVCREVGRVLRPGGTFHILFSNRLFLQKAVASWTGADDVDHAYTVAQYLKASGAFAKISAQDLSVRRSGRIIGDPLYCVSGVRYPNPPMKDTIFHLTVMALAWIPWCSRAAVLSIGHAYCPQASFSSWGRLPPRSCRGVPSQAGPLEAMRNKKDDATDDRILSPPPHIVRISYDATVQDLRSIWTAQELLTTFRDDRGLGAVTLAPRWFPNDRTSKQGLESFAVSICAAPPNDVSQQEPIEMEMLWKSYDSESAFPQMKVLKQVVRDRINPSRFLGHSDVTASETPKATNDKTALLVLGESTKNSTSLVDTTLTPSQVCRASSASSVGPSSPQPHLTLSYCTGVRSTGDIIQRFFLTTQTTHTFFSG